MISSQVFSGPKEGEEPVIAGSAIQWVLVNDGTAAWPEGTTLRLVGGPALMNPCMEIPSVAPYQTLIVDLEMVEEAQTASQMFYSLVTPAGQPFGEIMSVNVVPKAAPVVEMPVCVVAVSPMDGEKAGLNVLQGEIKTVEWVVANIGKTPWPEDTRITLFYNTPGFAHLPTNLDLPALEPGMTADVQISVLIPEAAGEFKAMWAVTSPTHPDFGDVLLAQFDVSDFPFMEWMLAEENEADSVSEVSSQDVTEPTVPVLSAKVAAQQHHVPSPGEVSYEEDQDGLVSLGSVSGLAAGTPWALELVLSNNGTVPWPADTAMTCCFGDGFGCSSVSFGCEVEVGQHICLHMELQVPAEASQTAWVMSSGDACFGPALLLKAQ